MSTVRPARPDDLPQCLTLARAMHAEAPIYRDRAFSEDKVGRMLDLLCLGQAHNMVMFVAEADGQVVGGIIGTLSPEWFNDELLVAEIALFVDPAHRRGFVALKLVASLVEWGRIKGATHVRSGIGTGVAVEGAVRLYEFLGFRVMGPVLEMHTSVLSASASAPAPAVLPVGYDAITTTLNGGRPHGDSTPGTT